MSSNLFSNILILFSISVLSLGSSFQYNGYNDGYKFFEVQDRPKINEKIDVKNLRKCSSGCADESQNCCAFTSTTSGANTICNEMIGQAAMTVDDKKAFSLFSTTRDSCKSSRCSWTLPNRQKCDFSSLSQTGSACGVGGITLIGIVKDGDCSISVLAADASSHNGQWTCEIDSTGPILDYVNITVNTGIVNTPVTLSAGTIMAITIPVGLLLIAVIVTLIICCCFPGCCASCRRGSNQTDARKDDETMNPQTHYSVPETPSRVPMPPPRVPRETKHRVQPQVPASHSTRYIPDNYEISEEEFTDSSFHEGGEQLFAGQGRRKTGYPKGPYTAPQDQVVYTHARPETGLLQPGSHQPKTARKISNTTSLHSFSPPKQNTKKVSVM